MSEQKPRKRLPVVLLMLALALAGGYFVWRQFLAPSPLPTGIVQLSGRIEGDDSAVAAKAPGRILEIRVREGDPVKAGDVIAVLDDDQIRAREQQAQFAVTQAEAQANSARQQVAILQEQLRQSELEVGQSEQQAEGQVRQAEAELAAAEAALAQQQAALKLAEFDRDAYTRLAASGAVSERQGLQAATNAETQSALVASARRRVDSARAAVTSAKASLVNPRIGGSRGAAVRQQIAQQQAQIAAAEAQTSQSRARLEEAQANRRDLTILAPFSGTVATRAAEPGEVVPAGAPIVTLLDLTAVYLRGFVPQGEIDRVRAGQAARVFLDAAPTTPLDAYVSRVDPQSTFTPENTYFRDDRVRQVVGVKLQIKEANGYAKPGMPADGEILTEAGPWPEGARRR